MQFKISLKEAYINMLPTVRGERLKRYINL